MADKELKSVSGMVKCLGWCNKEFYSPNVKKVRFCGKCKAHKNGVYQGFLSQDIRK